jgi:hypothetical protein
VVLLGHLRWQGIELAVPPARDRLSFALDKACVCGVDEARLSGSPPRNIECLLSSLSPSSSCVPEREDAPSPS